MLNKIIGSQSRSEIIKHLFRKETPSFYLRKLAREANLSVPVMHRELQYLIKLNLVLQSPDGNRVNFYANTEHPLYKVLCKLVKKCENIRCD